jgi:hypothetical protein
MMIHVPWFPRSVWVLDCPEADWDGFGGANAWPGRPRREWLVPWRADLDGSRIAYARDGEGGKVRFEAWVDGNSVEYRFDVDGLRPVDSGSFCLKTFSPFFSSQERRTQVRFDDGRVTRCCDMPAPAANAASFGWSLGRLRRPSRAGFLSYDGRSRLLFHEGDHVVSGNGWPPCTHFGTFGRVSGGGRARPGEESGGGRVSFAME